MLTPKEKSEELISTFLDKLYNNGSLSFKRILHSKAIECAIIAVKEILESNPSLPVLGNRGTFGEDIELSRKY